MSVQLDEEPQMVTDMASPAGRLLTYGPYLEDDVPTGAGNLAFDADLRRRNDVPEAERTSSSMAACRDSPSHPANGRETRVR